MDQRSNQDFLWTRSLWLVVAPAVLPHSTILGGWLAMIGLFGWLVATNRPAGKQVAMLTVWACAFLLLTVVGLQVLTGSGLKSVHS